MKHFLFFLFVIALYFLPIHAFAQCNASVPSSVKGGCGAVDTAIGTISTNPGGLAGSIMGVLLGFSGGVAILLIIASGYQMVMSQGNPEKVKEARERLTSAIVGLLFIIFSVFILQVVGIQILQIPGLK